MMSSDYNNPHGLLGDRLDEFRRVAEAIESGNKDEARMALDAIAQKTGSAAVEAVSRGRYSRKAKAA